MAQLHATAKYLKQPAHIALSLVLLAATAWPQPTTPIAKMAANELAARQLHTRFTFISEERSTRTGDHLWKEKVVETTDGPLRRLIAIDNTPLTTQQASNEQSRIDNLVAHPDDFRRLNQAHKDDEARATQLLQLLPTAFLLTPDGEVDGCTRFAFKPNPAFQPSSYQERVVHQMEGTVSLKQPDDRLCTLSATLAHPVEFGFGMLGHIDQGGNFTLQRTQVASQNWKSSHIVVNINGRILMLKTLAQKQDTTRTKISIAPQDLTLAQAAQLTSP